MADVSAVNERKIASLQALRTVAFLGIFLYHCGITDLGAWGVSVFFILSGFVLSIRYGRSNISRSWYAAWHFMLKRIQKLYPLHLITMCLFLLTADRTTDVLKNLWVKTALHIALVQSWIPKEEIYYSLNGVSWFLSTCVLMYFLFPWILRMLNMQEWVCLLGITLSIYLMQILVVCGISVLELPDAFIKWITYICPLFRLGDFIIGACFGLVFYENKFSKTDGCKFENGGGI